MANPTEPTSQEMFEKVRPIFLEMGLLASAWAMLELEINKCIWRLANVTPVLGACITAQVWQIDGRLKAVKSLMILRGFDESEVKEVNKFTQEAHALGEKRNRVIHDPILFAKSAGIAGRLEVTAKAKPTFEVVPVDAVTIMFSRSEIEDLMVRFIKFRTTLFEMLPSLPQMPLSEQPPIDWGYADMGGTQSTQTGA